MSRRSCTPIMPERAVTRVQPRSSDGTAHQAARVRVCGGHALRTCSQRETPFDARHRPLVLRPRPTE